MTPGGLAPGDVYQLQPASRSSSLVDTLPFPSSSRTTLPSSRQLDARTVRGARGELAELESPCVLSGVYPDLRPHP